MDFSTTLFRCSSLGYIMTEPRNKADKEAGKLSETAKTHLVDVYVSNVYGRNSDIQNKYVEKGMMVEEDSITLYSRLKKKFFKKNSERIKNAFIQGEPDLYEGKSILNADVIIDTKSSWDIYTFFRVLTKEINDQYYWQCLGYMDLTGAKEAKLAYCLINTPEMLITDEKRRLMYKMGAATEENSDFLEACDELDKLMRYDDIPLEERLIEFTIQRDQAEIDRMHQKVILCREYLNELYAKLHPQTLKKIA